MSEIKEVVKELTVDGRYLPGRGIPLMTMIFKAKSSQCLKFFARDRKRQPHSDKEIIAHLAG